MLAIQRRDPAAMEAVARECPTPLLRAARAAGLAGDDASDAVQDALLVFVKRAPEYDGRAAVLTWLFGILYNKIRERRRAIAVEERTEDVDAVLEARFDEQGRWSRPPRSPEEYTAHGQAMDWLRECLEGLGDRRRLAFALREVEQLGTDGLATASWRRRIAVRLHLAMCERCSSYARSLRELASAARQLATREGPGEAAERDRIAREVRRTAEEWRG